MTEAEKIEMLVTRSKTLERRIAKMEALLLPKKAPAKRKSNSVPKVKGKVANIDAAHQWIERKFAKKRAA